MQTNLSIKCTKRTGILVRTISALRKASFSITQQYTEEHGSYSLFRLSIQGPTTSSEDFSKILGNIDGILSVQVHVPDVSIPKSKAFEEQPLHQEDSAVQIAQAYPNIEQLVAQRKLYDKNTAPHEMRALGVNVATLRGDQLPLIAQGAPLDEFIRSQVIPELLPIAQAHISEGGLKVLSSIFTKPENRQKKGFQAFGFSMAVIDAGQDRCDFLCGYIQGMMNRAKWLMPLNINETYCRKEGQPFCLFEFK